MGGVSVHQPPQTFDRVEVRTVSWDEMQPDPAARPRQPRLHQFRVMVSGIVQEHVDQPHAWIHRLDRHQQHDGAQGIHRQHILHDGLTGLKVNRAMDVQTVPPAALFHRDRHLFRRPAADRPYSVGWMHRIDEDHRFIGGTVAGQINQVASQFAVQESRADHGCSRKIAPTAVGKGIIRISAELGYNMDSADAFLTASTNSMTYSLAAPPPA